MLPTNPRIISLKQECGTDLSSRHIASKLRFKVLLYATPVMLDFTGVRVVSHSFADELIAVLVEEKGEQWFRHNVRIGNASSSVMDSLIEAVNLRKGPANDR